MSATLSPHLETLVRIARAGTTMEWDTAAGHAVLAAAGGDVTDWNGAPFLYGKPGFTHGWFIARGK